MEFIAHEVEEGNYTKKADIWSLGATLLFMLTLRTIKNNTMDVRLHSKYKEMYSDNCSDVIKQTLRKWPKMRIGIVDLRRHVWFDDQSMLDKYDQLVGGRLITSNDRSNTENRDTNRQNRDPSPLGSSEPKRKQRKLD